MSEEILAHHLHALLPVFALIVWTLVMWWWMFITRVPAMQKHKVDPDSLQGNVSLKDLLPAKVMNVSDNYNHLHEQPVIFYALAFFVALTGGADQLNIWLLWGYVGLRVVHSVIQATINKVTLRFMVFVVSSILLMVVVGREAVRIFM